MRFVKVPQMQAGAHRQGEMEGGTPESMMTVRPVALGTAIASLFIVVSALFVLGSVPAYANAVGATVDGITYYHVFHWLDLLHSGLIRPTLASSDSGNDGHRRGFPVRAGTLT